MMSDAPPTRKELNDPEYRWYHKKEMAEIMPYFTRRKALGVKILNYEELRTKVDNKIVEVIRHNLDWDRFKFLIDEVPDTHDSNCRKKELNPKDRLHFERRDRGVCFVCGSTYHYGSCNVFAYVERTYKLSHLHHVDPLGDKSDQNIVTLCTHCHQMVHSAMFVSGKWKYGRPL